VEARAVLVIALALVAWLAIVGCCAALCAIASRGDKDEGTAANLEEWVRVAAFAQREEALPWESLSHMLRGGALRQRGARTVRRRG
jgi:hypothetical protein